MAKRKAEDAGQRPEKQPKLKAADQPSAAAKQQSGSGKFKNKEKVLVLGTRGITYRYAVCFDV